MALWLFFHFFFFAYFLLERSVQALTEAQHILPGVEQFQGRLLQHGIAVI